MEIAIDFIPLETIGNLSTEELVELILGKVRHKRIVILNGKLRPEEESKLIEMTMQKVSKEFPGIEICSISSEELTKKEGILSKIKNAAIRILTGKNSGITVIGPAKIVKKIKREPDKISLLTRE